MEKLLDEIPMNEMISNEIYSPLDTSFTYKLRYFLYKIIDNSLTSINQY